MAASKIPITMMVLMMIAGLLESASAVTHTVVWTFPDTPTEYDDWAKQQNFQVGDAILFVYSASHNVFEVSQADLDSCKLTSPIKKYETVNATVPLTRSGYFGYICGVSGHCSADMKMNVQVSAAPAPSSPPPSSTPTPPTSSPRPASPPTSPSSLPTSPFGNSASTPSPTPAPALSPSGASNVQTQSAMVVSVVVAGFALVML